MRKSREEAAQTRKQIVSAAAREFRKNGIGGTGLADLMKAAGLTHGGFYKHFDSKAQLIAEASAEAVETSIEYLTAGSGHVVDRYLSTFHRDHVGEGCALAAIGSEFGRSDDKTRTVATDGIMKLVQLVERRFTGIPAKAARRKALVAVATMAGALTLSRIVSDAELSQEILTEAAKSITGREGR